jgi:putative oxidoreductase
LQIKFGGDIVVLVGHAQRTTSTNEIAQHAVLMVDNTLVDAAGAGLLVGGVMSLDRLRDFPLVAALGDMLTRFSGIVMCSIATGVIWTTKPESLWSVILYDNLHVFLWVGGLYFALRGNWAVAIEQKIDTHP